jgi:hypothetical protein
MARRSGEAYPGDSVGRVVAQGSSVEAVFGALSVEMRGFVLGATLLGLDEAGPPLLTEPAADACAAAVAALTRLPRDAKSARLGQLAREMGAPFPAGLELVHSQWLRRALAAEPSDLLAPIVAGAPPGVREAANEVMVARGRDARDGWGGDPVVLVPELATELRRLAFMAFTGPPPVATVAAAPFVALSPPELLKEVRRLGARVLGASVAKAPMDVRARAMAAVGVAFAQDLREAAETADAATRAEAEAGLKVAAESSGSTVEERLEQMGILALERRLRNETSELRRTLAMRLPLRLGRRLLPADEAEPV